MAYDGVGSVHSMTPSSIYTGTVRHDIAPSENNTNQFDSVFISAKRNERDLLQKEWVGRISQEVRTATSADELRGIKNAVANGTYVPDPMAIAGRMLLLGEG